MTLIFSSLTTSIPLFCCSDVVISRQTELEAKPIELPMPKGPLAHRNGNYVLAGTSQKSVIFGRTMVMWSGWLVVAEAVIGAIRDRSENGLELVDPMEIITGLGLLEVELRETAFIYHHILEDGELKRWCLNCEYMPDKNERQLAASGSGVWNFFENIEHEPLGLNKPESETAGFLSRIALHSILEFDGTHSLDYLYGGWFELTFARPCQFDKIPYAIKLWHFDGEVLGSGGPTFFGWYSNDNLIVSRLTPREEVVGQIELQSDHFVIADFLKRTPVVKPEAIVTPHFVVNIVVQKDLKTHAVHITPYEEGGFTLEAGPRGIDLGWTNELRAKLMKPPAGPAQWVVDRLE